MSVARLFTASTPVDTHRLRVFHPISLVLVQSRTALSSPHPPAMATSLPPEILTDIFRLVPENTTDLHSFARVFSTWCAPAQRLLFQHVVVPTSELWGRLLRRLPVSPHLREFIRTLEMRIVVSIDQSVSRMIRRLFANVEELVFAVEISYDLICHIPDVKRICACDPKNIPGWYTAAPPQFECPDLSLEELVIHQPFGQTALIDWLGSAQARTAHTLLSAALLVYFNAPEDRLRQFLGTHRGLQKLTLEVNVQFEGFPVRTSTSHHCPPEIPSHQLVDTTLGQSDIEHLTLNVPLEPMLHLYPAIFGIFRDSSLPRLHTLVISFGAGEYEGSTTTEDALGWSLPMAVAGTLKKVAIHYRKQHRGSLDEFMRLFGVAFARVEVHEEM
jgi:hypothetical protein